MKKVTLKIGDKVRDRESGNPLTIEQITSATTGTPIPSVEIDWDNNEPGKGEGSDAHFNFEELTHYRFQTCWRAGFQLERDDLGVGRAMREIAVFAELLVRSERYEKEAKHRKAMRPDLHRVRS